LYPVSRITGTTVSLTEMQAPSKARKALAQAGKALQKDKLDEAEKSIKEALDLCPKYAPAWLLLGRVYQREKRTDEARTAFTKAVAADEKFVSPLIELARMAGMETNWKETADLADRALELDPADFPEAYFLSAVAGYNQNHFDLAEKNARRAQLLDYRHQFPEAFLLLGRILHEKRDSAGEAEQLRNFLKYAPQSPNSVQVRAELQELERTHPDLMARSKQPK
jgi:tetratricopeptide (TPR) repeat protein